MLDFVHMSGAGNTFLVADGRDEIAPLPPGAVRSIIEQHPRHDGASIEGVLILRSIAERTVTADFYNPDGSYGMMCGNGARCSVRYACDHGAHRGVDIALLLNGVSYDAICHDDQTVSVTFPSPLDERAYIVGELANIDIPVYYVNVNSDHVVIDGPRDAQRPVVALLRHHAAFPRGTNVSMVELEATDVLRIATFERGVEAVTGACGTGAISACIAWWRSGRCSDHVVVIPPSQRPLTVVLHHSNAHLTACTLRGDALYDNT
jgi:diaminopimelate epimerase